jgi:hypothetical protein
VRLGDWRGSVAQQTERVSGDGGSLVLVSRAQLTGYANDGHEEVYLYSLAEGGFRCVSCNPTGGSYGEAVLIPDTTNAYQPRWLSEDGTGCSSIRLKRWRRVMKTGRGMCMSGSATGRVAVRQSAGCVFLISSGRTRDGALFDDATPDGSDVFFTTRGQLTPEDGDEQSNVFDARVGGGFPYTTPAGDCASEAACRPAESTPPALAAPASAGPPPPEGSVEGESVSRASVLSVKHDGALVLVRVRVSGEGRVTLTGDGLAGFSRTFTRAGVYTLRARLSAAGRARAHTRGGLALLLRIHFTPPVGRATSTTWKSRVKIP